LLAEIYPISLAQESTISTKEAHLLPLQEVSKRASLSEKGWETFLRTFYDTPGVGYAIIGAGKLFLGVL